MTKILDKCFINTGINESLLLVGISIPTWKELTLERKVIKTTKFIRTTIVNLDYTLSMNE